MLELSQEWTNGKRSRCFFPINLQLLRRNGGGEIPIGKVNEAGRVELTVQYRVQLFPHTYRKYILI